MEIDTVVVIEKWNVDAEMMKALVHAFLLLAVGEERCLRECVCFALYIYPSVLELSNDYRNDS